MNENSRLLNVASVFSLVSDVASFLPSRERGDVTLTSSLNSNLPPATWKFERRTYSGKGWSFEESFASLVGEVIERSFAHGDIPENVVYSSPRELSRRGFHFVSPEALLRDNLARYRGNEPVTTLEDKKFAFVAGTGLVSGKETYVPARAIWFGHHDRQHDSDGDRCLDYLTTSSGLCCHRSRVKAEIGALNEIIERHDFMTTWIGTRTLRDMIKLEYLIGDVYVGRVNTLTENFDDYSTYIAFHISDVEPRMHATAASSFDPNDALYRSLAEMGQVTEFRLRRYDHRAGKPTGENNSELGYDLSSAAEYYESNEGFAKIGNIISRILGNYQTQKIIAPNKAQGFLRSIHDKPKRDQLTMRNMAVELFKRLEMDPILIEIANRSTSDLGLHISRCFCLDLVPLTLPALMPFSHPSLASYPTINREMHPFD